MCVCVCKLTISVPDWKCISGVTTMDPESTTTENLVRRGIHSHVQLESPSDLGNFAWRQMLSTAAAADGVGVGHFVVCKNRLGEKQKLTAVSFHFWVPKLGREAQKLELKLWRTLASAAQFPLRASMSSGNRLNGFTLCALSFLCLGHLFILCTECLHSHCAHTDADTQVCAFLQIKILCALCLLICVWLTFCMVILDGYPRERKQPDAYLVVPRRPESHCLQFAATRAVFLQTQTKLHSFLVGFKKTFLAALVPGNSGFALFFWFSTVSTFSAPELMPLRSEMRRRCSPVFLLSFFRCG